MTAMWDNVPEVAAQPYREFLTNRERNRPLYLRIETVNTCNNLCIICAYRDQTRPKRIMPMAMFEKAVQDYVELGGGFLSLTPLVGDVFMDRDLLKRLDYLESVPEITELGLTTNGAISHRFDDDQLRRIVRGFDRLSISIYGIDPVEYEAMTKRDTYARMVEGIRRIVGMAEDHPITLEFRLLNKRNKHELFEWLTGEVMPGVNAMEIAAKTRINSVITDYANWGIYNDRNTPLPADARWFASERKERHQCLIPMFNCMVFSDGNVSFCGCDNYDDTPELRLGNIMRDSLADMYNSEIAARLWDWKKYGTPAFCQGCSFHIPLTELARKPSLMSNPYQIVGSG